MKAFNPEKVIFSELKIVFLLLSAGTLALLFSRTEIQPEISLHPWLSGLFQHTVFPGTTWTIILRVLFIAASTFLARILAVRHFDIPARDYMLVAVLPIIHFTINDWNIGLLTSVYWTVFLLMLFLLIPGSTNRSENRSTLTAALICGLLLLNGAFAFLFFLAGIVIMISMHTFSIRNVMIWITGFMAPAFFVISYYEFSGISGIVFNNPETFIQSNQLFQFNFSPAFYASPVLLFLLALSVHSRMSEFKISIRRSYSAMLLALTLLLPAILASAVNSSLMFSLLGLASAMYWIKNIYISQRKFPFFILWLLPILLPVLYYFVLKL